MTLQGHVFEAASSHAKEARLTPREGRLFLTCRDENREQEVELIRISDRLAGTTRRLELSGGRVFATDDDDGADALLAGLDHPAGSPIFRLESLGKVMTVICLGLLLLAGVLFYYGLPLATDLAALAVPDTLERRVGGASFDNLEGLILEPSQLDAARQARVKALFSRVAAAASLSPPPELHLRAAPALGANAFAFPGGPVVVTDDLVLLAPNDAALAGVLAHEIAHIESRHGLRRLLRAAGWAMVITAVIGDAGTLLDELAAFPMILVSQGYSRGFETEADARAVVLMRQLDLDPKDFAAMLGRLRETCGTACGSGGWWASHPGFKDRIEALKRSQG